MFFLIDLLSLHDHCVPPPPCAISQLKRQPGLSKGLVCVTLFACVVGCVFRSQEMSIINSLIVIEKTLKQTIC